MDLEGKRRRWSALEREGSRRNDKVTWPPSTQGEMKPEQEKDMVSGVSKEQGELENYSHPLTDGQQANSSHPCPQPEKKQ